MIKRFYTAFTIYIMVMLYAPPVYSINFFFSHLGVEDGLSQVSVLDIFQDSDGYIWFGTRNGANRYDGYEFVVYQNEVNNNATLTDNYIRGFAEDDRKNIWIATSNGINCIDYKTKKITRFYPKSINKECTTNIINRLLKHSDGNVYAFCNRSVFKCSMNQTVETVFPDIAIPSPTYSVAQAPDKDIYIRNGEQRLVHLFRKLETKKTRTHRRYHCNHITGQQRGYMAGTRRNRNLPLQQKQTDLYMVAQG